MTGAPAAGASWIAGQPRHRIGLGAMPLSTAGRPDREQAIGVVHAALDAGVDVIDTADAYCLDLADTGHNERLVAEALARRPEQADRVLVATKGGHVRGADGSWHLDGRPEHLEQACRASLAALGRDVIDLYQLHRPDPAVPFLESVGALAGLREQGLVRHVGLSNVTTGQLAQAQRVVPVVSVQNELSPDFRSSLPEVAACEASSTAFLAWAPLGGSGAATLGERHPAFAQVGEQRGVSAQRVALAWALARSPAVLVLVGARRTATLLDSLAAVELQLSAQELARLD